MFFVHGPAGFLAVTPLKRAWKKLSNIEQLVLFLLGFFFGIGPDVDLLYYYFVDASTVHRHFITHAPLPWLLLGLAVYIIGKGIKKPVVGWAGIVIAISTSSHLLLDMIPGRVQLFWPISDKLIGLSSIPGLPDWIGYNITLINYSCEAIILATAVIVLGHWALNGKWRWIVQGIAAALGAITISILFWINGHVAHTLAGTYFDDLDGDGIENSHDRDLDGDGIDNSQDKDADGDGILNTEEIAGDAERFRHLWYVSGDGTLFEFTRRFGVVNNTTLFLYILDEAGVVLGPEMEHDYEQYPSDYTKTPDKPNFSSHPLNLQVFFEHQNLALGPKTTPEIGDIVVVEKNGGPTYGLVVTEKPAGILYADSDTPADIYDFESLREKYGIRAVYRFKK